MRKYIAIRGVFEQQKKKKDIQVDLFFTFLSIQHYIRFRKLGNSLMVEWVKCVTSNKKNIELPLVYAIWCNPCVKNNKTKKKRLNAKGK